MLIIDAITSRTNHLVLGLKLIKKMFSIVGVLLAFLGLLGTALLYEIKESLRWIFHGERPESP